MTSEPTFEPTLEPTVEPTFDPTFKPAIDTPLITTLKGSLVDRWTEGRVLASLVAGGAFVMVLTILGWQRCSRKCKTTKDEDFDSSDDGSIAQLPAPLPSADEGEKKYDLSLPTNIFSAIEQGKYPKNEEAPSVDEETPSTPDPASYDAKEDTAPFQDKKYDLSYVDDDEKDMDSLISEDDESYVEHISSLVTSVKRSTTKVIPDQERSKQRSISSPTSIKNNTQWKVKGTNSLVLASLGGHISKFDNDDYYYWVGTGKFK